ncbi:MAG: CHAT domain-containing protein [Acidobacteriota bacterium]
MFSCPATRLRETVYATSGLAGAKSVLASLWTDDDIFATALMKRFYQHLVAGRDKGAALRQAKLDLLQKFGDSALPIYWAGFVLVGDGATWNVA